MNGLTGISDWFERATLRARLKTEFNFDNQLTYIKQLETLRGGTGIKLSAILAKLKQIYISNKGPDSIQAIVTADLQRGIIKGQGLTQNIGKWFDKDVTMIYQCADYAGKASEAVTKITSMMSAERKLKKQIFQSIKYPLFISAAGLALALFGVLGGVPFVENFASNSETPLNPDFKTLQGLNVLIRTTWPLFIAIPATLIGYYVYLLKSSVGLQRQSFMTIPILKIPFLIDREFKNARYIFLLAMMNASDLKLVECVKKLNEYAPKDMRFHLNKMIKGIAYGEEKANYFGKGMLSEDSQVSLDLIIEQGSSGFDEALKVLADNIHEQAEITVMTTITAFKASMLVFAVGVLGLGVIALLTVMGQLTLIAMDF